MRKTAPVRFVWLCFGALAGPVFCAMAQSPASALPRTSPTAGVLLPGTSPGGAAPGMAGGQKLAPESAMAAGVAHRARVSWSGRVLSISAENSSLNQILREVCRQTGMKVTGGVTEERVYGTYGPGIPGTVLASLLQGTGSNFLLKENAASGPVELVLSPRQGGPTPMSPLALSGDDAGEDDLPPQRTVPTSRPTVPGVSPRGSSGAAGGQTGGIPAASNPVANAGPASSVTAAPATATTDQQSPNGVRTPQQIYDELMKLQQQKTAVPGTPK